MEAQSLSAEIRAASRDRHAEAESSPFMRDILGGRLGVEAYTRYTEQLWFVYRALEDGAARLAGDPVAGPFLRPELARVPALERDLAVLRGEGWRRRAVPLPATRRYVRRIRAVAGGWPGGYVAHHYTRYLGDLAGGQVIRRTVERLWGFPPGGDGVRFYVFDGIANVAAFRRGYRAALDAVPLRGAERARFTEEVRAAFAHTTSVLAALHCP